MITKFRLLLQKLRPAHVLSVLFLGYVLWVSLAALPEFLYHFGGAFYWETGYKHFIETVDQQYEGMLVADNGQPFLRSKGTYINFNGLLARALGQPMSNDRVLLKNGHLSQVVTQSPDPEEIQKTAQNIARFHDLYEMYLENAEDIYFVAVPDKSYYMAQAAGVLSMDYEGLFEKLAGELDFAEFINITDCLDMESYYRTDTHWRQEKLLPVMERLGQIMGLEIPTDYEVKTATDRFYGVYYGQAALPMPAEDLNWMVWEGLEDVQVQILDNGTFTTVYNEGKLSSKDPYESFLSGNVAIQVVENPNAASDRHLVLFRDSFGSSIAPLLSRSYGKITLVDTRYINPAMVGQFVDFEGAEVLFLYSTLILNTSSALRK